MILVLFGLFHRKPRLPRLPRDIVAVVDGQLVRVRRWYYSETVYQLMPLDEVTFLGDLFYNQEEFGIAPSQEQADRAREVINRTVALWLTTEMGRAWRQDNWR